MNEVKRIMEKFGDALVDANEKGKTVTVTMENDLMTAFMSYDPAEVMVYNDGIELGNHGDEMQISFPANLNLEFDIVDDEEVYRLGFEYNDTSYNISIGY